MEWYRNISSYCPFKEENLGCQLYEFQLIRKIYPLNFFLVAGGAKKLVLDCAGIFKQSMGARNRVGIGLSYRTTRLYRLAELIHWNRFLGSLNV